MSAIQPIKKNRIAEAVFDQIKDGIAAGEWAAGQKIPSENELAAMMNVSRISVHAAIQRLKSLGLVESRQGGGTFIRELDGTQPLTALLPAMMLTETNLRNVIELRMVIEAKSTALAAERCTPETVAELKAIYKKHSETSDLAEAARLDLDFHFTIAKATGNPLIIQVYSILYDAYAIAFGEIVSTMGTAQAMHYHALIIKAIEAHDANLARDIMEEHVERTIEYLEKESRI